MCTRVCSVYYVVRSVLLCNLLASTSTVVVQVLISHFLAVLLLGFQMSSKSFQIDL
jgi:hypothetical protein